MNVISVKNLSKSYDPEKDEKDKKDAIIDVSLDVACGDLVCILGPNGSGKSTLLKCIAGLLPFESGTIELHVAGKPHKFIGGEGKQLQLNARKKIGVVLQDSSLWHHKTVLENVAAPLRETRDKSASDAREDAKGWLQTLAVPEKCWPQYPKQLSGGLARRVAIARTFATEPDILLLDEVEVHLDPPAVGAVLEIIDQKFVKDPNRTVVMITHRLDFITQCASQVAVFLDGRLAEHARPSKILKNPEPRTAKFIKEVVDPIRSESTLGSRCLESARSLAELTLVDKAEKSTIYQRTASEMLKLITKMEPDAPHLVLIVTRETRAHGNLFVRAACKNEGFILNGQNVGVLGKLVQPSRFSTAGDRTTVEESAFVEDYVKILEIGQGVPFDTDHWSRGLITMMFQQRKRFSCQYSSNWDPIEGVYCTEAPPRDPAALVMYYEFSTGTKYVYLFPMLCDDEVVGVLSIDTYSEKKWRPFVVEDLLAMAALAAITLKATTH